MIGIPIVAALWLVAAPFLLGFAGAAQWSNIAAGVASVAFALWPEAPSLRRYGLMLAGAYVVIASLVLWPLTGTTLILNLIAAVAVAAGGYLAVHDAKPSGRAAA
jgi:hypothetical protein